MSHSTKNPYQVAVVGATGYSGFELARILLRHPKVQSATFYVRETGGAQCLAEMFPQLRGVGEAPLRTLSVEAILESGAGTAFLATPHEFSAEIAPTLIDAGIRVVDLSGAFRFRSAQTFSHWYKLPTPHAGRLGEAVYGLRNFTASGDRGSQAGGESRLRRHERDSSAEAAEPMLTGLSPTASRDLRLPVGRDRRRARIAPRPRFVELDENFKAYNLFRIATRPEILDHTGIAEGSLVFYDSPAPAGAGILFRPFT